MRKAGEERPRGSFEIRPDGGVFFRMFDRDDKAGFAFVVHPEGAPIFTVFDRAHQRRAGLVAAPDGNVSFDLIAKSGKKGVSIGVNPDGNAGLNLYEPGGAPRVAIGAIKDRAGLTILDDEQRVQVGLGTHPDGTSRLVLLDRLGTVIFQTPKSAALDVPPALRPR